MKSSPAHYNGTEVQQTDTIISDFGDVQRLFQDISPKVAYISINPNMAVGFEEFIEDFHSICLERASLVRHLRDKGVDVFCLEEAESSSPEERETGDRSTLNLFTSDLTLEYLKESGIDKLLFFKVSARMEQIAVENGWGTLSNPAFLARSLENKLKLPEITETAGVAMPKTKVAVPVRESFRELEREIGLPFIAQFSKGFGGSKTFFVDSKEKFEDTLVGRSSAPLKFSQFIDGHPITINACIAKDRVIVGAPAYQITGIRECTPNEMGSCGNDFSFSALDEYRQGILRQTRKVGEVLKSSGFRGVFGLDFVAKDGQVYIIEINPRFTASLPLYTGLQIESGDVPLVAMHVLEHLNVPYELNLQSEDISLCEPASSILLYNTVGQLCTVEGELESGVYRLGETIAFARPGTGVVNVKNSHEAFVSTVPRGSIVKPAAEYGRIYIRKGALADKQQLHGDILRLVDFIKNEIRLTPM